MARLTWQNVNAPSFAGIGDNYRVMSQLLGNASRSGMDMLDTIQQVGAGNADRAILQRMVGVQDPAAYDPNTIIGSDGSRASLSTLKDVGNYADTLMTRAVIGDNRNWNQYNRERTRTGNEILDSNADGINMARSMAVAGNISGARGILDRIQGLRPEQYNEILGDVDQYGTRSQARDVVGQNLTQQRYNFGNQIQGDRDARSANEMIARTLREAGSSPDARASLERQLEAGQITPEAFTRAIQGLGGFGYGNVYQPFQAGDAAAGGVGGGGPTATDGGGGDGSVVSGGGLEPSAPGTAGTRQGNPYDVTYQFTGTDRPITSMSIGDVLQHQSGMIRNQGHSPVGAFQINKATLENFAPNVLGEGWRDQPMSPENQEKIAEAIFNARKGGNLKKTWDALPNATPGAYADYTWEEVRQEIAKREVGAELPSPVRAGFSSHMASRRLQERLAQNNALGISSDYAEALSRNRSPEEVARALVGAEGPLPGTNKDFVLGEINRIVKQSNGRISPDVAGEMLERSLDSAGGALVRGIRRAWDPFGLNPLAGTLLGSRTPTLSGNQRINENDLDSMIQDYLTGQTSQRTLANESMATLAQAEQAAQAQYQASLQQYQAALMDAQTRPGAAQNLPRYRDQMQQAAEQLDAVQKYIVSNPNWSPEYDTTRVPEPSSPLVGVDTTGPEWIEGPFGLWKTRPVPVGGGQ